MQKKLKLFIIFFTISFMLALSMLPVLGVNPMTNDKAMSFTWVIPVAVISLAVIIVIIITSKKKK